MSDKIATTPTMLAVAHGTKDLNGVTANLQLLQLVRGLRPELPIVLCWLDIAEPTMAQALAEISGPVVVVPVLLSTGYHVKKDIPALIGHRPATVLARHLGPDDKVLDAVLERLTEQDGCSDVNHGRDSGIVLIGSGSSDPEARVELAHAADRLAELSGQTVRIGQLTDDDPLKLAGPRDRIASYLLAPGYFAGRLKVLAAGRSVSDPISAHPQIAELILQRFDEAVEQLAEATGCTSSATTTIT